MQVTIWRLMRVYRDGVGVNVTIIAGAWAIIKVSGHEYCWLAGGNDLEVGHFLEVVIMVVTWWIVAF